MVQSFNRLDDRMSRVAYRATTIASNSFLGAFLPRNLRALLAGLGQANGDRLLSALHLSALAAGSALQRAFLAALHRALDAFARGFAVLSPAFLPSTFLCRHARPPDAEWSTWARRFQNAFQ